ncbi:MAG: 16S rRNA (uracil(1498)-N(3))-methyltransferase [Lactobacillus sp.]|uniref:RsmE family RNA methyltransferase n=1 Tax=Bombilactobacillus bombi TaxID=1303590 RepID=UPI0035E751E6|nr:16S rRNA (uracil(1498)-N(3))-methyltransferase [Lactobacillus sp.]
MQQIFLNQTLDANQSLTLADDYFQHLIKVLRLQINDQFWVVDAVQNTFKAQITAINARDFQVSLTAQPRAYSELPVKAIIACALSKKDKVDWITQKATELGAHEIIFFKSQYSIMKWSDTVVSKKLTRLNQIALNAAQQAHRLLVPQVHYFATLEQLIAAKSADFCLVAYEEAAKQNESSNLAAALHTINPQQSIFCLFGPEGGFTVEEIAQLRQNDYNPCGLGPRILRAETAPLYFLSALSYQIELDKDLSK